jgi:ubiquinone/menaquinone biosynthesis C-methylase UbiE
MKRKPVTHGGVFEDEAFAGDYARKHRKMAEGFGGEYARKLRKAGFTTGRILDAGCGSGATNLTLARRFPESELVGIDLSDPLLGLARQDAESRDLSNRVRFERADVRDIPFGDDAFDVALCLNMVHLVQDPERMLAEVERVLAPDGFLFIADLRRSFLGILEREIRSALSVREARDLLDNSALRNGTFSSGFLWWRFESLPSGE